MALALARQGFRVTVIEQAKTLSPIGAGIQISPNASRVLIELGLDAKLRACASSPESIDIRNWKSGALIFSKQLGRQAEMKFGAPYLNLHRADLQTLLYETALGTNRVEVVFDAQCASTALDDPQPRINLANGKSYSADVLIGADGIKSAIRYGIAGDAKPRFTGCVAWRGVIPVEQLRGVDLPNVSSLWLGPRAHFVHYHVRNNELMNFVAVTERKDWTVESWTEHGDKNELVAAFSGWHAPVPQLIQAAPLNGCYKWALFDRRPMQTWSKGSATLIGDACHPMLPFAAQGACMAIEDAWVLSKCLKNYDDPATALQHYEQLRKKRTAAVQNTSRANKILYHLPTPLGKMRDLGASLVSGHFQTKLDKLFAYDVTKISRLSTS